MQTLSCAAVFVAALFVAHGAQAAERTVTLTVKNMSCALCGPIVQKSLSKVSGVKRVDISMKASAATVVFDDAKTNVPALVAATAKAGFPSRAVRKAG